MAKGKKRAQVAEPTREELSEFAYLPTGAEGFDTEKPFGSQSYKHMKGLLMQRVNPSRYVHSISVAKTARKLARAYGYDGHVARMAGLLHDWDKALLPTQLSTAHFGLRFEYKSRCGKRHALGIAWAYGGGGAAA